MVLAFLELGVNLVSFLAPFLLLPISLLGGEQTFYRLSFVFASFYLVWGLFKFVLGARLTEWSWVFELPLLGVWMVFFWMYLPSDVGIWYSKILEYSGPALLVVEAVQIVRIIMHTSYRLVSNATTEPDRENIIKFILMSGSLFCYLIFGVFAYKLYHHKALTIETATFLTIVVCTIIALTVTVVFFVESGSMSDTAMLSVFLIFIVRMTVHYSSDLSTQKLFNGSTQVKSGWNMLNYYAGIGTQQMTISQLFSLDFLAAGFLAIATIFSFPYFSLETEDTTLSSLASEEDEASTRGWQTSVFGSIMTIFYSHIILSLTGIISPSSESTRMIQASIAILYYIYRLYKSSVSDGFKED